MTQITFARHVEMIVFHVLLVLVLTVLQLLILLKVFIKMVLTALNVVLVV